MISLDQLANMGLAQARPNNCQRLKDNFFKRDIGNVG